MLFAFDAGSTSLFAKLVRWKTEGPYSHLEAIINVYSEAEMRQFEGANPALRVRGASADINSGVRYAWLDLNPDRWDIIDVPGIDSNRVETWFDYHEGDPYDIRGILNFILPVGHNPNGWFCDAAIMAAIGSNQPWRFDPNVLPIVFELMGGKWLQRAGKVLVDPTTCPWLPQPVPRRCRSDFPVQS